MCRNATTDSRRAILLPALIAALLASLTTAGCSGLRLQQAFSGLAPSGVIQPAIVPSASENGTIVIDREFTFEDKRVRLSVPIDRAVYAGSVSAEKSVVLMGDAKSSNWIPGYYRAFVGEPHQEAFFASAIEALHAVSQNEKLDSDRYLELVTSMVQGMVYRHDPGNLAPKFPIETFGDGYGDCDDKTLLAASLLAADGYDVAILVFQPEKHVALGVRAPGLDYKGTGYAYVELTEPSLVGVPTETLGGGVSLESQPEVIKIGQGTGTYTAGTQIQFIERRLEEIRAAEKRLQGTIKREEAALSTKHASLEQTRQSLQAITDPHSLELAAERFNQDVQSYNDRTAQLNRDVARYNALVDAERYAAEHQTARPQVYARLKSVKP